MRAVSDQDLENYRRGGGPRSFPELQARVDRSPFRLRRAKSAALSGAVPIGAFSAHSRRLVANPARAARLYCGTRRRDDTTATNAASGDNASCAPPRPIIDRLLLPMRFPTLIYGKQALSLFALSI